MSELNKNMPIYDEVVERIGKYRIVVKRGINGDNYGVVDNDNNVIIPIKYGKIVNMSNDFFIVEKNLK